MKELTLLQTGLIIDSLPGAVVTAMKAHPEELVLAGGFIRSVLGNEVWTDIDLFVSDYDVADQIRDGLMGCLPYRLIETDNAFTLTNIEPAPVQIIHNWEFARPEDVINLFDFSIAKAAIWWNGEVFKSNCDENYFADLRAKRLRYAPSESPEDSLPRVLKFYGRGYRIDADSLARVVAQSVDEVTGVLFTDGEIKRYAEQLTTVYGASTKTSLV